MSTSKRVAVVTGSNKGIGYAIVRGLCKQFPGDVILTARSEENGRESVKKLNEEGLKPLFHQLDITDDASVRRMRDFLQMNYGGLDVLVNNAAIAYKLAREAGVTSTSCVKTPPTDALMICIAIVTLAAAANFIAALVIHHRQEAPSLCPLVTLAVAIVTCLGVWLVKSKCGRQIQRLTMRLRQIFNKKVMKVFNMVIAFSGILCVLVFTCVQSPGNLFSLLGFGIFVLFLWFLSEHPTKMAAKEPFSKQVEVTMATNFCGTLNVCRVLFPLLRPHARVVHLSSRSGSFTAARCSKALQTRFLDPELSMLKIEQLMNEFVESAKADIHKTNGWHDSAYGTTKIGVTLMTYVQQREFSADSRPDIVVNSCCPGFVVTDMTSQRGTKTIDEGADTPLYLAMLPANTTSPKGQFVCEREIKTML